MILVSRKDKSVSNRKPQLPTGLNRENWNFANQRAKTANYLLAQNEWMVAHKVPAHWTVGCWPSAELS
jgi:hypothetical protein